MYLMPLPLYGSGGRWARILAATSPTACTSAPTTVILFCTMVTVTPVGMTTLQLTRLVRAAGREPIERDTFYNIVNTFEEALHG